MTFSETAEMTQSPMLRQAKRFQPYTDDPYFELNSELTKHLLRYGEKLRRRKVLDFGCGERPFSDYFALYEAHTISCDVQQNRFGTVDVVLDKSSNILPFESSSFDVICMFDVLEHIPDDVAIMSELGRILKDDGLLIFSVPFMYRFHEIPDDYRRYTPTGIEFLLRHAGLSLEEVQPIGSTFFVVDTLLRESKSTFSRRWASLVRRLSMKIFFAMRDPSDPCSVSPFSFFAVGQKKVVKNIPTVDVRVE